MGMVIVLLIWKENKGWVGVLEAKRWEKQLLEMTSNTLTPWQDDDRCAHGD